MASQRRKVATKMVVDTSKVVTNTHTAKVNLEVKRVVRSQQRDSTTKAGAMRKVATRIITTEKVTSQGVRITESTASHPSRVAKKDAAKHPTITNKRTPTSAN